jgi:hypothetical protein
MSLFFQAAFLASAAIDSSNDWPVRLLNRLAVFQAKPPPAIALGGVAVVRAAAAAGVGIYAFLARYT